MTTALATGGPAVVVRSEELEHGFFELDPCNLSANEAKIVADRIGGGLRDALAKRANPSSYADWRSAQENEIWDV
jgi:L-seryl-tRNA(Ser) seleniumtransferase